MALIYTLDYWYTPIAAVCEYPGCRHAAVIGGFIILIDNNQYSRVFCVECFIKADRLVHEHKDRWKWH